MGLVEHTTMTKSDWMKGAILCVAEVLWDSLPTGIYLGGAPFNVACHLHRMQQRSTHVSRVGDDVLGREALCRIRILRAHH
jgi:fructokinase